MLIEVAFARARYSIGEDVPMRVRVTNDGDAPVTVPDPFSAPNWQPVYVIWRDGEAPRRVSFRSYRFDDPRDPPDDGVPELITLAPGETREDDVPFRAWGHIEEPGQWHVYATLTWEGISVQSPEAGVEVIPFDPVSISIGVDVGVPTTGDPWVSWLLGDPAGCVMGQTLFHETRPDLGEIERQSGDALHPLRASVMAVYTPWTTYDRAEELTFWRAWRDGQHLAAMEVTQGTPHWHDLGEGGAVIHPVVMSRGGALTACVRTPEGALRAVRFTTAGATAVPGPALPGSLHAARVTPDPSDQGDSFVVAALCEDDDGAVCGLLARFNGPSLTWSEVATFSSKSLAPLPRSAVGVTVVDAKARAGFMAHARDGGSLVRVEVEHDGALAVREDLGSMDDVPWATAVAYGLSAGASAQAHWVVLVAPTVAFSSRGPTPFGLPGRPVMPPEALPISQSLYLAVHDPRDGVSFHMLR